MSRHSAMEPGLKSKLDYDDLAHTPKSIGILAAPSTHHRAFLDLAAGR